MEDDSKNPTEQDLNLNSAVTISNPTETSSHDHDHVTETPSALTGESESQNDATVPNHPTDPPVPVPVSASDNTSPSVAQTTNDNSGPSSGSDPSTTSTSTASTTVPAQPPSPAVAKLKIRGQTFVLPNGIPLNALTTNTGNRPRLQMLPNGQMRMEVTPGHFVTLEREQQQPPSLNDMPNVTSNTSTSTSTTLMDNNAESRSDVANADSTSSNESRLPQMATTNNHQPGAVTPTMLHNVGNGVAAATTTNANGASNTHVNHPPNNNNNATSSIARNIRITVGGQFFEGSIPAVAASSSTSTSTFASRFPHIQSMQLLDGGQQVRLELGQGNFAILNRQEQQGGTGTNVQQQQQVPTTTRIANNNGAAASNQNGNHDPTTTARGNHETPRTSVNGNVPTSIDTTTPDSNHPSEASPVQQESPSAEANNDTASASTPSSNSETPALNATSSPSTNNDSPAMNGINSTQSHRDTFGNQSFGIPNRVLNNSINPNPTGQPQIRRVNVLPNGQVQLDLGQGNFVTINRDQSRQLGNQRVSTSVNGNQVNLRVVQINPLTPIPLENSDTSGVGAVDQGDDDESLSQFKCAICYHWMKDPVGCGVCASRFCNACLLRVATGADRQGNRSVIIPAARCPTCRVEFSQASIIHDEALKNGIFAAPPVPCKYDGCDMKLQLPLLADHEKECEHALVKCRYVSFGCSWTGKRQAVQHHEDCHCHLAKISAFIEQMREMRGDHSSRLEMIQQQATGAIRMQAVHRQNLQLDQLKSTSNIFHLFEYCQYVTCATPHFLYRKDSWAAFWRTGEAQGTVLNFLTLLPTSIICLAISSKGYRRLWRLLDKDTVPVELLEEALLCMCIGAIWVLVVIAHFADSKSSSSWGIFPSPVFGAQYMIRDVIALAAFTIYIVIMEYQISALKAFFVWWLVATGTAFFPGVIAAVAAKASGLPPPTSTLSLARSIAPVLFGLRYSLVAVIFDITACLDAACLMLMTRPWLKKVAADLISDECFLQLEQPPHYFGVLALAGARLAVVALQFQTGSVDDPGLLLVDSVVAFLLLLAVNFFIDKVYAYGMAMGTAAAVQAQADVRPDGIRKEFNLIGIACFGVWVATLGALALSG
jgi:hypothetical protein